MPLPPKTWHELLCEVPAPLEETLAGILIERGATGTWTEDTANPDFKKVHAYYNSTSASQLILKTITNALVETPYLAGSHVISVNPVQNTDWISEWKKHYEPINPGKNLHILPSWHNPRDHKGTIIRIDPGMAFGTGGHPTTKLCLVTLEEAILESEFPETLSLLDVGCGSGILAIAGKKLGIGNALGVDNDPVALENAQRNVKLNEVEVELLPEIPSGNTFHMVISNIYAETLIKLKETFTNNLKDHGLLILSGILREKAERVFGAFSGSRLSLQKEKVEGEWVCQVYKLKRD